MLKQSETEDTIGFLSHFYDWWYFDLGRGRGGPLAMPMTSVQIPIENNKRDNKLQLNYIINRLQSYYPAVTRNVE